jgi:hypothetical protein
MLNVLITVRNNIFWFVQFVIVVLVAIWLGSLAVNAIASKLYPNGIPIVLDIRCALGYPSQTEGKKCIQDQIDLIKKRAAKERKAMLEKMETSIAAAQKSAEDAIAASKEHEAKTSADFKKRDEERVTSFEIKKKELELAKLEVDKTSRERVEAMAKEHRDVLDTLAQNFQASRKKLLSQCRAKRYRMMKDHKEALADRDKEIEKAKVNASTLEQSQAKAAELLARMKSLETKWTNISLFSHKTYKGSKVTSGVRYPSLVTGIKYDSAWCYWYPKQTDIPVSLTLGETGVLWGVNWNKYTDTQLRKSGITRSELEEAKKLCQWPEGVKS